MKFYPKQYCRVEKQIDHQIEEYQDGFKKADPAQSKSSTLKTSSDTEQYEPII